LIRQIFGSNDAEHPKLTNFAQLVEVRLNDGFYSVHGI